MLHRVAIGTAGWTIPAAHRPHFAGDGSHLARYARRLTAVEINSTFYRPHRPATFARWAEAVPKDFRFAAKVPKEITHERRLVESGEPLKKFLREVAALGDRLDPLLVQLPPSLAYEHMIVRTFLTELRKMFSGAVVCEPRHASWFTDEVDEFLRTAQVARVAADPAPVPPAAEPGGWNGLVYYRLHGSPRMYFSAYAPEYLEALAHKLIRHAQHAPTWCIFDNTAHGHAAANALTLSDMLAKS